MMQAVERLKVFKDATLKAASPQLEAELLGCPLWLMEQQQDDLCLEALDYIGGMDTDLFYSFPHKNLCLAYGELSKEGLMPSAGHFKAKLQGLSAWSEQPAKGYISPETLQELSTAGRCPHAIKTGSLLQYLKLIHEDLFNLYRWRCVVTATKKITTFLQERPFDRAADDDIAEQIAHIEAAYAARQKRVPHYPLPINIVATRDVKALEKQVYGQATTHRTMTPFAKINTSTGGFLPGNLVVLAARTSMGKTGMGLDIALTAAKERGLVVYFSLEMSSQEITRRIAAKESGSSVLQLRAILNRDAVGNYKKSIAGLGGLPLFVDDKPATPRDIEERCEHVLDQLPERSQLGLIVVDHIQLLGTSDKLRYESRHRQLSTYVYQLKDMAKRFDCVVLALSQVNRLSDREKRAPRLSDLRESGAIEETADIIIGLYRKAVDDDTANIHEAEVRILKNRSGPLGRLSLFWAPETATFHDPDSVSDVRAQAV